MFKSILKLIGCFALIVLMIAVSILVIFLGTMWEMGVVLILGIILALLSLWGSYLILDKSAELLVNIF